MQVVLKRGKEKAIKNRHHWIFSGAVHQAPGQMKGEILPVYTQDNELLGYGYFNSTAKIIGRMVSFGSQEPMQNLHHALESAVRLRRELFKDGATTGYRLINGEGDCLPGLVVDRYADVCVIQVSTLGMERLKPFVIDFLKEKLSPRAIYEKSNLPSRKEEGLPDFSGLLDGQDVDQVEILENGLKFIVSIKDGQKTGFFLDHRLMREEIRHLAHNKRVLNCFSYTGGFSVYAAAGGASKVDSVDISEKAGALGEKNAQINGCAHLTFTTDDVFQYLRKNPLEYDLVILDPPAFAKKQKDIIQACRGYKDINRIAMQKMPPNSLLLTCSCSYYVDESLFQKVVFQASVEAKRTVKIIGRHHLAADHPINLCHPEGDYLKSFLLYIA